MSILQVQKTTGGSIGALGAVVFNEILEADGNILYDLASGEVTISENGIYVFDWWVSTQSTSASNVRFNLNFSGGNEFTSNSPMKTGNTSGFAIIEATDSPITVTLQNANSTNVFLSSADAKAELRVFNIVTATSDASECFSTRQLINVLEQVIVLYPGAVIQVYTDDISTIFGTIDYLFTATGSDEPSVLVMSRAGSKYYVSIYDIDTFYIQDSVYDDSINYLPLPTPFVENCSNATIRSFYELAEGFSSEIMVNTDGGLIMGTIIANEYGIIVLSDEGGAFPRFIVTSKIRHVETSE